MVDIIINKEFIQDKQQTIIKNGEEEEGFINELKNKVGSLDTTNISNSKSLERVVQDFMSICIYMKYIKVTTNN